MRDSKPRTHAYFLARNAAHAAVDKAVRQGRLVRLSQNPVRCIHCNERRALYYEHRDYNEPLDVTPACAACNARLGIAKHTVITNGLITERNESGE